MCILSIKYLFKFNPNAKVFVLSDFDLNIENCNCINISDFLNNIDFHFDGCNETISGATYYRLFIPYILKDIDKCIYLDADTLVCGSLDELWNTEVEYIGGVKISENLFNNQKQYINSKYIINTGVLLMNLKNLINDNLIVKINEIKIQKNIIWFHDQSILNILYANKINIIDKKYNFCIPVINDNILKYYLKDIKNYIENNFILHFVGNKFKNNELNLNIFKIIKDKYLNEIL